MFPLYNGPDVLSSLSDKAKLFTKNFLRNSYLDGLGFSLTTFSSRTNLKLHNIPVTPKLVKKCITNLDLSKGSDSDGILVVVLKNYEPELSRKLTELFNMSLKEAFPQIFERSHLWFLYFLNVGERSADKKYCPARLFYVVSKIFEKLVNNRLVDHLEKCDLFSDFHCRFRSSRSTVDLLTVA